jgi:hypothetical protein
MCDGSLRLISPAGLVSWMTRGIHYRALQAAERRPHPRKPGASMSLIYLGYSGALGEVAVRCLVGASHRAAEAAGAVVLHGEHAYKVGKKKHLTPDLALVFDNDIVLFEIYSGRMSLAARAGADRDLMLRAVDKATSVKLVELADRTSELLAGAFGYRGLDLDRIRRVWPVVVLAGDPILQTQALWAHFRSNAPSAFLDDTRVQRPILMDLDDLDPMLAAVERGTQLPDLLRGFLESDFAELPPRNWMKDRFPASLKKRPVYVDEQFEAAVRMAARALFPGSEHKVRIAVDDE